ncbi:hypothetical protein PCASD_23229 [Puccinia coronata f. sp. avenae]|uniref:Uncharacterized protein n=1 Tax=Puccinia coronata f. sp. avenae TaxID=200324 RepID=A0A2N5SPJ0_9BASI|nr:hypothetical protein PCASD_23229 [Puccinia coronata f. sp. avenae]
MRFCFHFLLFSLICYQYLGIQGSIEIAPEMVTRTTSSDSTNARVQGNSQRVLGPGASDTCPHKSFRDHKPADIRTKDIIRQPIMEDPEFDYDATPSCKSYNNDNDTSEPQEQYYDLNEGIEPGSKFHENNLRRPWSIFTHWFKQLSLRIMQKFCGGISTRTLIKIYKTASTKGIYDPISLNLWDTLDAREIKIEAAPFKKKLLEDLRCHPAFLNGEEQMVTAPELVELLDWFEEFKKPPVWLHGDFDSLVTKLVAKMKIQDKIDRDEALCVQLIKYIAFFNPEARDLLKLRIRSGTSNQEVPAPDVWRKLIISDLFFRDHPRQTLYPQRYHGLLEQLSLEWREEFRRRSIAGKLNSAGGTRKTRRQMLKISGKAHEIRFITEWPLHAEGNYDDPKTLVRRCVKFLSDQAHLPPEKDSIREHPVNLVYRLLNHIYEHSTRDPGTQRLIKQLIRSNIYWAHKEVLYNMSRDAFKSERDMPHYEKDELGLKPLVIPSSEPDSSATQELRRALQEISRDMHKTEREDIAHGKQRDDFYQQQAQLLSRIIEIVSKGPTIWRTMRKLLVAQPDLKRHIFSLLSRKVDLIWEQSDPLKKRENISELPQFLQFMEKEITEFINRSSLIHHLENLVNEKIRRNLIESEVAMDISGMRLTTEHLPFLKESVRKLPRNWSMLCEHVSMGYLAEKFDWGDWETKRTTSVTL